MGHVVFGLACIAKKKRTQPCTSGFANKCRRLVVYIIISSDTYKRLKYKPLPGRPGAGSKWPEREHPGTISPPLKTCPPRRPPKRPDDRLASLAYPSDPQYNSLFHKVSTTNASKKSFNMSNRNVRDMFLVAMRV